MSLLNDIFASASMPFNVTKSTTTKSKTPTNPATQPQPVVILSPQPYVGSAGPQVLNSQVLTTILTGSAPSRTPSVASAVSHPSSREGDNEDDSESDSPYTVLDEESDPPQRSAGASAARMAGSDLLSAFGFGASRPGQRINGDVTPRGPLTHGGGLQRNASAIESTLSISTVRGSATNANPSASSLTAPETNGSASLRPRNNRALVPFEPDSELWPYSRGPVEDSSPTDDDDIVELNFEETSVLSNPEAFNRALKEKKSAVSLRSLNGSVNGNGTHRVNGSTPTSEEKGKGKNRRKTRKERDAKARDEIEQSWDTPSSPTVSRAPAASQMDMLFSSARLAPSSSPSPAPEPVRERLTASASSTTPAPEMKTPTMNARATLAQVNGHNPLSNGAVPLPTVKGKIKMANGYPKITNGHGASGPVDPDTVKESMIATIDTQARPLFRMDKNEFMREVVMLIHVSGLRLLSKTLVY